MKYLLKLLCLPVVICSTQAAVIIGDASIAPGQFGADYELGLNASIPEGEGLFLVAINQISPNQFQFSYLGIAQIFDLFIADQGLRFVPDYVSSNISFMSNSGATGPGVLNLGVGESVTLAYWDDRAPFNGTPDFGDNFGWVEILRTADSLTTNGSVTAIGSGIIVGTATTIPEARVGLLSLLGLLMVPRRRCSLNSK